MAADARYEILDGLRGVAALGVLIFHLSIVGAPYTFPRGYLAVDFFFVLSGFVIAHSYTSRLDRLSLLAFFRIRARRIFPLSILGTLVGSSYFLFRLAIQPNSQYTAADVVAGTFFNLFLLPKPWVTAAPTDTIFPTNTPLWSLSFEMAVNLFWAALLYRFRTAFIGSIAVVTAVALAVLTVLHGSADLGATWPTFVGGLLRALFGFCAGMLIWRYRPQPGSLRLPPSFYIAVLLAVLCATPGGALVDVAIVTFVWPLLIYLAICGDGSVARPYLQVLGRISYPLYIVHVPLLLFTVGLLKAARLDQSVSYSIYMMIPICALVAAGLDRYYDQPIRKLLGQPHPSGFITRPSDG
ncbi:MAG: acyltransferase [Ramlibacter sp.]|nr:acyltransferase [Ramlibacter sp.]